jgi:tetratricopeptide (TPR) repeat protein
MDEFCRPDGSLRSQNTNTHFSPRLLRLYFIMHFINAPVVTAVGSTKDYHGESSVDHTQAVAHLNNMCVACIDTMELDKGCQFLQRALDHVSKIAFFSLPVFNGSLPSKSQGVSKNLYIYQRGEYDEGMHTYSQPLAFDESASLHCATSIIFYNLGQLCMRMGEDNEASEYFNRALHMAEWGDETSLRRHGLSVVAIFHNIAHVEYRNGRHEEAIQTYSKALDYSRNSCKETSHSMLEVASTLNCLGVLYFHMPKSETDQAMSFYNESLAIRRAVLGADCETKEVATTLNNIGRIHYMKGEHDPALITYHEALQIRRRLFGDEHLDVAATVYNAGQTHHQRGERTEAMALYNEFLTIAKKLLGMHHRDVAIMLKCIAQIYHEQKEYALAKVKYQEALTIGRSALGNLHPEVASTLNKLGNLLYEAGEFPEAIRVYNEGLEVERAVLDVWHPNICVTLTNLVSLT